MNFAQYFVIAQCHCAKLRTQFYFKSNAAEPIISTQCFTDFTGKGPKYSCYYIGIGSVTIQVNKYFWQDIAAIKPS